MYPVHSSARSGSVVNDCLQCARHGAQAEALTGFSPSRMGSAAGLLRIGQHVPDRASQGISISWGNEPTRFTFTNDFLSASGSGGNDGLLGQQSLRDDASKRLGRNGRMHYHIYCINERRNVIAKTEKMDAIAQSTPAGFIAQALRVGHLITKQRLPHQ